MKKYTLSLVLLFAGAIGMALTAVADVQSLRGEQGIADDSSMPAVIDYIKDQEPLNRDYLQQPPLIPHKTEDYIINVKSNKCLSCHSWKTYKKHNATKISQTHFENRDGAILSNVSSRRYFCTQCHVPQADAEPLIENTFEPVDSMRMN